MAVESKPIDHIQQKVECDTFYTGMLRVPHNKTWEDVDKNTVEAILASVTDEEQAIMMQHLGNPPQDLVELAGGVATLWILSRPARGRNQIGLERFHELTQNWRVNPIRDIEE